LKEKVSFKGKIKYGVRPPKKLRGSLFRKLSERRRKNDALDIFYANSNSDSNILDAPNGNTECVSKNNTMDNIPEEEDDCITPESEFVNHRRDLRRRKNLFQAKTWRKSFYNNQFISKVSNEQKTLPERDSK